VSRCVADPHAVVPQQCSLLHICNITAKGVAFLQHPCRSLHFYRCWAWALLLWPTASISAGTFEGLWTSLNPLKPLNLFETIEGLWSLWRSLKPMKPLNPLNRSYSQQLNAGLAGFSTECSQICQLIARRCSGYLVVCVQWSMPTTEAPLVYIFNSIWCFGLSVNQKWCHLNDQLIDHCVAL